MTAKLRLEKKGRGGKSVTIVDALPDNGPFLEELAKALKKGDNVALVGFGTFEVRDPVLPSGRRYYRTVYPAY